jgi:hypothetical protein
MPLFDASLPQQSGRLPKASNAIVLHSQSHESALL